MQHIVHYFDSGVILIFQAFGVYELAPLLEYMRLKQFPDIEETTAFIVTPPGDKRELLMYTRYDGAWILVNKKKYVSQFDYMELDPMQFGLQSLIIA